MEIMEMTTPEKVMDYYRNNCTVAALTRKTLATDRDSLKFLILSAASLMLQKDEPESFEHPRHYDLPECAIAT